MALGDVKGARPLMRALFKGVLQMRSDLYLRFVLTVIAAALVYLCVALTPMPAAYAQDPRTPIFAPGPAEVVIVGWKLASDTAFPVQIPGRVNMTGDVKVIGDVRVNGHVQTEPAPNTSARVILAGWEDHAAERTPGRFIPWNEAIRQALPVASVPPR